MRTTIYKAERDAALPPDAGTTMRTTTFVSPRRRWPGILAATVVGACIAAAAVSSYYDKRSIGERVDAVGEHVNGSMADAGITAAVKTSLAADPALSALKIDVSTTSGVVRLTGPAPDDKARERAEVLAAAPKGVVSVDNQLVVPGSPPPAVIAPATEAPPSTATAPVDTPPPAPPAAPTTTN